MTRESLNDLYNLFTQKPDWPHRQPKPVASEPNIINLAKSLDPLCGVRLIGLMSQAKSKDQRQAVLQDLTEWIQWVLPVGTFIQPSLDPFKCGWVSGYGFGGNDQTPILLIKIKLHNGQEILSSPDLLEHAVYDASAKHHFPVFVHDRDCITREAIALEYLRQSPLTGDIVGQVCTETAQWMQRLYTERVFSPLPDSIGVFIERLVAHPNREAEPILLARKAADWLEQAAREYEIAFARQPRTTL